jgi:hypothetical protein
MKLVMPKRAAGIRFVTCACLACNSLDVCSEHLTKELPCPAPHALAVIIWQHCGNESMQLSHLTRPQFFFQFSGTQPMAVETKSNFPHISITSGSFATFTSSSLLYYFIESISFILYSIC